MVDIPTSLVDYATDIVSSIRKSGATPDARSIIDRIYSDGVPESITAQEFVDAMSNPRKADETHFLQTIIYAKSHTDRVDLSRIVTYYPEEGRSSRYLGKAFMVNLMESLHGSEILMLTALESPRTTVSYTKG